MLSFNRIGHILDGVGKDAVTTSATALESVVPIAFGQSAGQPASRLVGRIVAEAQLAAISSIVEAMEKHCGRSVTFDRAIVLTVIMRAAPHWHCTAQGHLCPESSLDQAISVNAIATSLSRPFETIRRHVNALVAGGICERTPRGIVMASDIAALPALYAAVRRLHDLMILLIDYARVHGVGLPSTRPTITYQPSATIAAMLELVLAAAEYLDPHYDDWLEMAIVNAVLAANARPITFNRMLAARYPAVDTVPPEHLRVPVAVADIARALHVPYSTAQRQVNRSIAKGQLKRVPGGVMVTAEQVEADAVTIAGPIATARAMRAFGRLVPGGFRFDNPASCYLDGPPPLLDFGNGSPTPIPSTSI